MSDRTVESGSAHAALLGVYPGEQILSVRHVVTRRSAASPSALSALLRLCDAPSTFALGATGPPRAAAVTLPNAHLRELNKFQALFGRDALITSMLIANKYPKLMRTTLCQLASLQGTKFDLPSEEEPGRIPHEVRDPKDPAAKRRTARAGWGWPYYGSIDATPLFIAATCQAAERDLSVLDMPVCAGDGASSLRDALVRSTHWLCRRLDNNPHGLLFWEGKAHSGSIRNQVWKDSSRAFVHATGIVATPPLAPVELQGLAFDALAMLCELAQHEGVSDLDADVLYERAKRIRNSLISCFWVDDPEGPYPALGLDTAPDGALRPLAVRSSNMGHLLASRILDGEDAAQQRTNIVEALFSPDLLCPAGIRTLSSRALRFSPGSYHNGSSWLWDTCFIGCGLHRHGWHGLGWELWRRACAVCEEFGVFPEFARGDAELPLRLNEFEIQSIDAAGQKHSLEQLPQEIQAWTVAAVLHAKIERGRHVLGRPGALPSAAVSEPMRSAEHAILEGLRQQAC